MQISIIEDDTSASQPHPHHHHHLSVIMLLRWCKRDSRSVKVMVAARTFDLPPSLDVSELQKFTKIPALFTIK